MLIGCSKDDLQYQNDFEKSYKSFQKFTQENNNTYSYTKQIQSWVGTTTQTRITVEKGEIVKREFYYHKIGNQTIPEGGWTKDLAVTALKSIGYTDNEIKTIFGDQVIDKLQWVENKENLASIDDKNELMTLEQVYLKAKNEWIIKRDTATIYFESKNDGMISLAGYVPNGCQDDCFNGITIIEVKNLED